jgi:hypothetical protein
LVQQSALLLGKSQPRVAWWFPHHHARYSLTIGGNAADTDQHPGVVVGHRRHCSVAEFETGVDDPGFGDQERPGWVLWRRRRHDTVYFHGQAELLAQLPLREQLARQPGG